MDCCFCDSPTPSTGSCLMYGLGDQIYSIYLCDFHGNDMGMYYERYGEQPNDKP